MNMVMKILTIVISIACSNTLTAMLLETKVPDQQAPAIPKTVRGQQDLDALYMRALNTDFEQNFKQAFNDRQWHDIQDLMESKTYSGHFHKKLIAHNFYWARELLEKAIMWEKWKWVFLLITKFDSPQNMLPDLEEITRELEITEKQIRDLELQEKLTGKDQNWLTQEKHRRKYLMRIKAYLVKKTNIKN